MSYLDSNSSVIEWASEEFFIPYISPIDDKYHRYFPDFWIKKKNRKGEIDVTVIEIKPRKETAPPKKKSRVTKQYLKEVQTWGVNNAKWKAAEQYCKERDWNFMVLTEKELGIR